MASYEAWNEARGAEIIATHADQQGATLPILHGLQEVFGCVPAQAVPMIARSLNMTRAEVHGIVSLKITCHGHPQSSADDLLQSMLAALAAGLVK